MNNILLGLVCTLALTGATSPSSWTLTWSDEFNGKLGQPVDASKWSSEVGGRGFGNKEMEYYTQATDRNAPDFTTKNAYLDGDGHLVILATTDVPSGAKCWYGTCKYASARLLTLGKFAQAYGRVEARIKIPQGRGLWPAFWMMGDNIRQVQWPRCGEIDIMEAVGEEPATMFGSAHGPGFIGKPVSKKYTLPSGKFSDDYHVFAVEWSRNPAKLQYFVDDVMYETITPDSLPSGSTWVFDHPFFILLNLAVGGWARPADPSALPAKLLVDYVRVYRHSGESDSL